MCWVKFKVVECFELNFIFDFWFVELVVFSFNGVDNDWFGCEVNSFFYVDKFLFIDILERFGKLLV